MYLSVATETTGLPRSWRAPVTDLNNWPRMVQIAWILTEEDGTRIAAEDHIILPEGYRIPRGASKVHGITTERALAEGKELQEVLEKFNELVERADALVAHNISFDEKIVGAELLRKKITTRFFQKRKICTMESSTDYCRIPGPYGYKWPRLSELHHKLFGEGFEEAHNAAADIQATERCFREMKKMGLIG